MGGHSGIVGHRPEEAADDRPPAGEQVGLRRTEAFVVQRSTNQSLESAEPLVRHRLRDDVPHAVVARAGRRTVVVGPRQDLEREVVVALEVFDERGAAAHIGLLKLGRRAVPDNVAVVPQGIVDGVVAPARTRTGLQGYHIPPPPEYANVPPNRSLASTNATESPSRAAV